MKLLYWKSDTYPRFLSKFIFCPRTNFWHIFACEYITVYIVPNKRADGTIEKTFHKYKCINILFWNIQGNIHLRNYAIFRLTHRILTWNFQSSQLCYYHYPILPSFDNIYRYIRLGFRLYISHSCFAVEVAARYFWVNFKHFLNSI